MTQYSYEYILLNIDKPQYNLDLHPNHPLMVGNDAEIGVRSIFLWYTYPNISEKYNNNKVKIYFNDEWHNITIPTGMYEVEALSDYLNSIVTKNITGDEYHTLMKKHFMNEDTEQYLKIFVDKSTFKCRLLLKQDIEIDFSEGKLHELLGLEPKIYNRFGEGDNIVNITRGVDRILFRCNLVERKYQKDIRDVLYDVLPLAEPGSAIQEQVDHVEYYKCRDNHIRRIEIRVTDKDNNYIDLVEPISMKIVIRFLK